MYGLEGKVAVVTGVGRPHGIGRSIALRLARKGSSLVLADIRQGTSQAAHLVKYPPDLEQVASEVAEAGVEVLALPTDVSVKAEVEALLQAAVDRFGGVDTMVCNAAIETDSFIGLEELSQDVFTRVLDVILVGTFLCAQAAAGHMIQQGQSGKIITIGSRAARQGFSNKIAYSAAKFGVIGFTQAIAQYLAPHGIRVNCVCPGTVDTDHRRQWYERRADQRGVSVDEIKAEFDQTVPLGRHTTPDDIAGAVAWLASSESDHVTGQALNVNGGGLMS